MLRQANENYPNNISFSVLKNLGSFAARTTIFDLNVYLYKNRSGENGGEATCKSGKSIYNTIG